MKGAKLYRLPCDVAAADAAAMLALEDVWDEDPCPWLRLDPVVEGW